MQVHHVGFRIRGFYRLAQFGHRWSMTTQDAQHRLQILQFFARHGPAATCEAFGISRRTLYRWKQTFTQAGGNPAALAARSSAPWRRRQSTWPHALIQEIRRLRTTFPNLGKVKLQVLLRPWCTQQGLALPSVSTIGRLIARAPDKMRHAPVRLDARGRPKPVARPRKARQPHGRRTQPLEVFACDTVVRLQAGLRRYLFTFIDPPTRFAVAVAAATASSRQATLALDALCHLLPAPPRRTLQSHPPRTVRGLPRGFTLRRLGRLQPKTGRLVAGLQHRLAPP